MLRWAGSSESHPLKLRYTAVGEELGLLAHIPSCWSWTSGTSPPNEKIVLRVQESFVFVCAVLAIICGLVTSFPAAEVLWRRTTLSPALYLAESWIKLGRFTRICSSGPYRFRLVFIPEDTACSRPSRFREADNRRHSFPFGGVVVVSFEETLAKRQKNKWIYSLFLCSKRQMVSTLMCSCLGVFVFCWLVCFLLSPQWLALPINGNRKAELLRPLEQMFSACLLSRKLKVEFHPWDYSWISEVRAMQIS